MERHQLIERSIIKKYRKTIWNNFVAAIKDYQLIKPGDKILTLSTCDTVFEDARFVVMARLVRDGESTEVDTSKARVNTNQRFPQAWYDAKGERNPFRNADNFTID